MDFGEVRLLIEGLGFDFACAVAGAAWSGVCGPRAIARAEPLTAIAVASGAFNNEAG